MIDIAIAYIIAVVAAFAIQAEMNAVTAPNANKIRTGRPPIQGSDRMRKRQPAVEPMQKHGARQDERADEQEDQRIGEWQEDFPGRRDLQQHAGRRARSGPSAAAESPR